MMYAVTEWLYLCMVGCLASNMDALMYDYRQSAAGQIGSTITTSGVPYLHTATASAVGQSGARGYGTSVPPPSSSPSGVHAAGLTQSLLSSGERTEADSKVKGTAAAATIEPWTGFGIEEPERADAFVSADGIRKSKEKQDKDYLYSASVGMIDQHRHYTIHTHTHTLHGDDHMMNGMVYRCEYIQGRLC